MNNNKGFDIINIFFFIVTIFSLGFLILNLSDFDFSGIEIGGFQFEKKNENEYTNGEESEFSLPDAISTDINVITNTEVPIENSVVSAPKYMEYTTTPENNEIIKYLNKYGSNLEIGSSKFNVVWNTDGNRDYDISQYYKVQRIRVEENPSGCDVSSWFSDFLWITGNKGAKITLNNDVIGELNINTGSHGYLIALKIKPGDQLCIEGKNKNGFSLVFGPDVYYHYDSYCFRGYCK